jgi:RimJ/RimL family protein N-acetyltransferase
VNDTWTNIRRRALRLLSNGVYVLTRRSDDCHRAATSPVRQKSPSCRRLRRSDHALHFIWTTRGPTRRITAGNRLHHSCGVKLLLLDSPGYLGLAAGWLARKENYQWLDFGNASQPVSPALLKIMAQRETHFLRLYTADQDDVPIGIVGLNSVSSDFSSATFWGAAGEKSFRSRGYGTLAGSKFLTLAFRDLGLHAINTWVVEHNPSLRIIERLGFRFVGRLRQCHHIDSRPCDRLLFDLLASEHRELDAARWRRIDRSHREPANGKRLGRLG